MTSIRQWWAARDQPDRHIIYGVGIVAGIIAVTLAIVIPVQHAHSIKAARDRAAQARIDNAGSALVDIIRKECDLTDVYEVNVSTWKPGDDLLPASDGDVYSFKATDNSGVDPMQVNAFAVTWPGMTAAQINAAEKARPRRVWFTGQFSKCAFVVESQTQFNKYGKGQIDQLSQSEAY